MEMAICWFRQDLRLSDNPAWTKAAESGKPVVPVFIWSPGSTGEWNPGAAGRWWLHHALQDLAAELKTLGHKLILRIGPPREVLFRLIQESGSSAVFWNRCYEPVRMREDSAIKKDLQEAGLLAWSGNSALLWEPWTVSTQAGKPFKVYTPFSRACKAEDEPVPVVSQAVPGRPDMHLETQDLESFELLPRHAWTESLGMHWTPTRECGRKRLNTFLSSRVAEYGEARDYPAIEGVSGLSPYLHWGQIGPREVLAEMRCQPASEGLSVFYNELLWREFAHHVLYHFPETTRRPLNLKFENFPWKPERSLLKAWQTGRTGYPIVDAGMRELWQTGWMHNRVRMIVGSFLVKHLLQSWDLGARWFWDTLVDADLANNTLGWQWVAGCGADAAPYFRIFNPMLQSEKFDREGRYIRRYIPELKKVPDKFIHTPWEMPESVQSIAGCHIGKDYPRPVVEHRAARERALAAFDRIKEAG